MQLLGYPIVKDGDGSLPAAPSVVLGNLSAYVVTRSYVPVDENGKRILRDDWGCHEWHDITTTEDDVAGMRRFERGRRLTRREAE